VLVVALVVVGLTDAQVAPPPPIASAQAETGATVSGSPALPQPAPHVLVLVNGAETMLGDTVAELGQWQAQPVGQRAAAPKWTRTIGTVEALLRAMPEGTHFRVAVFHDEAVMPVGGHPFPGNAGVAIAAITERLRSLSPRGAANLEAALQFVSNTAGAAQPERIVLVTDGLPTAAMASGPAGRVEADRKRFFEQAVRRLPPRIPVETVLLPAADGDAAAAGLYWNLANATRGRLTVPAKVNMPPPTHLVFVVDTSGSMRDPKTAAPWAIVVDTVAAVLNSHRELTGVQLMDADGRFILGRNNATGLAAWHPDTPELRAQIRAALAHYAQDTVSNPVPGVYNALRFLKDDTAVAQRMAVYLLGDELNTTDAPEVALSRLDTLNPRDATGRRRVAIHAIGFPTTIRFAFSMGNTGLRFASFMQTLTQEHDGSFVALPNL
jgi:hypothetical protein